MSTPIKRKLLPTQSGGKSLLREIPFCQETGETEWGTVVAMDMAADCFDEVKAKAQSWLETEGQAFPIDLLSTEPRRSSASSGKGGR